MPPPPGPARHLRARTALLALALALPLIGTSPATAADLPRIGARGDTLVAPPDAGPTQAHPAPRPRPSLPRGGPVRRSQARPL
ncbi:hypothetical protein [Kitasatospora herbaricolor]|uniref:Uncharacterized protein n=1 Tax=Kitasatospora herbaricolor TaxID=68217 RepID=A0ABZ1W1K3_9ACTN|nr:hypothetical protein [Kitasatospora herbaricolor]